MASDVAVQKLTSELKEAKSQLVKVTAEKLELSKKLIFMQAESHKRLEELAVMQSARDRVEELVLSIVGQSVLALDASTFRLELSR